MSIEDEIINEAGKQMAVGIDFEILTSMLVDACGWHRIEIIDRPDPSTAMDIIEWVDRHCKGKHMKHQRTYVFEDQGDAVNFTLRWL